MVLRRRIDRHQLPPARRDHMAQIEHRDLDAWTVDIVGPIEGSQLTIRVVATPHEHPHHENARDQSALNKPDDAG